MKSASLCILSPTSSGGNRIVEGISVGIVESFWGRIKTTGFSPILVSGSCGRPSQPVALNDAEKERKHFVCTIMRENFLSNYSTYSDLVRGAALFSGFKLFALPTHQPRCRLGRYTSLEMKANSCFKTWDKQIGIF